MTVTVKSIRLLPTSASVVNVFALYVLYAIIMLTSFMDNANVMCYKLVYAKIWLL